MEESEASMAADHAGAGADLSAQQEPPPPPSDAGGDGSDDVADDSFEFAFAVKDEDPDTWPGITAEDIFSNGFIRPVYPVFGRFVLAPAPAEEKSAAAARRTLRSLFVAEREEDSRPSSSEAAEQQLEGVSPATYCVWRPRSSPAQQPPSCQKSRSTGSSFLRRRLQDLVVWRSQSEGKEKFVFLPAGTKSKDRRNPGRATKDTMATAEAKSKDEREPDRGTKDAAAMAAEGATEQGNKGKASEVDAVASQGFHYGRGRRRSVLPYKEELVGFLANVNALSRTHHPF